MQSSALEDSFVLEENQASKSICMVEESSRFHIEISSLAMSDVSSWNLRSQRQSLRLMH